MICAAGDLIDSRPGCAAMPARTKGNGVQTVVVETSNRFGRDLMVQEVGFIKRGAGGAPLVI